MSTNIWNQKNKEPRPDQKKECYFCHNPVTEDEFCPGCGEYVCGNCEQEGPFGSHNVQDHKSEEDLEEDDA